MRIAEQQGAARHLIDKSPLTNCWDDIGLPGLMCRACARVCLDRDDLCGSLTMDLGESRPLVSRLHRCPTLPPVWLGKGVSHTGGRVVQRPSQLCNPRDIELMARRDPPTKII